MKPVAAALAVVAALAVASPASAQTVSCGQVITKSTKVANDLVNCPGDGLVIGADNITLDLAGHTIDGAADSGSGVRNANFDAERSHTGVTIKNGVVRDFGAAVNLHFVSHNSLRRLWLVRNGGSGIILVGEGADNVLDHNVVRANGTGILLSDSFGGVLVRRNLLVDNDYGIRLGEAEDVLIERNRVLGSGEDGILLFADTRANVIRRNLSSRNGDDGIEIEASPDNVVAGNTANHNGDLGIEAGVGVIDGGGNRASGNGNPLQCVNVFCR